VGISTLEGKKAALILLKEDPEKESHMCREECDGV
jgi:hypothetical protein